MSDRDNHNGPRFDDVVKAYPDASRYHWQINRWLVATRVKCADSIHTCNVWKDVFLSDLDENKGEQR